MSVYELRGASIAYDGQEVLSSLDWTLARGSVGVVFGGGGVGKSSLLRALTGVTVATMTRAGSWSFRGDDTAFRANRPLRGVVWCGQPPRDLEPVRGQIWRPLASALEQPAGQVIVLDEPNAWLHPDSYHELVTRIREAVPRTTVLLSTHHVEFGRACADRVTLLGGRHILTSAPAEEFFAAQAGDDARMFVRTGNVVPRTVMAPPPGLRWVIPGVLGGMGWPGTVREVGTDLRSLADAGVTHLVTLTRQLVREPPPADYGLESHHYAIRDMGVPTMRMALRLAGRIVEWIDDSGVVVVHCRGGIGRTGMVLAMVLVQQGDAAEVAIEKVRAVNRHYIQTSGQLRFVGEFEEALRT